MYKDLMLYFVSPGDLVCAVVVPVPHCKDTYYFEKENNFFKEDEKERGEHPCHPRPGLCKTNLL